ncbi:MAG: hypothetical protein IKU04_00475 [Bacteroidales bacterium]|nr:hypothetical protein [Bacteroidales bacterium]
MTDNYDDIINLPHHTSRQFSRMPLEERAAQFSPFAALTGYDALIRETAKQNETLYEPNETQGQYPDDL